MPSKPPNFLLLWQLCCNADTSAGGVWAHCCALVAGNIYKKGPGAEWDLEDNPHPCIIPSSMGLDALDRKEKE